MWTLPLTCLLECIEHTVYCIVKHMQYITVVIWTLSTVSCENISFQLNFGLELKKKKKIQGHPDTGVTELK